MTDRDVVTRLQRIAAEPRLIDGRNGRAPSLDGQESTVSTELQSARELVAQLELAVEHRTVIGQATGILMERFRMAPEAAFAALTRISSTTNTKVYEVARQLVADRDLPGLPKAAAAVADPAALAD